MISFQENQAIETIRMFYMFIIWNQIYVRELLLYNRHCLVHFIDEYHDVFNEIILYIFEMNSNPTIVLLLLGHK